MPSTPVPNGRADKSSKKQSKIIILRISSSTLKRFIPKEETPSVASSPTPPIVDDVPKLKSAPSQENNSEGNSTPAPTQDLSILEDGKTKGSLTNGVKRSTPMPSESTPKPRGKPGPKKKPRLEDGTIDHGTKPVITTTANHKLGPKANTGFINANLRALDRSGTPCRRWQKNGFQLKSFTGHTWEIPSWKGLDRASMLNGNGDHSSAQDLSMQDSSDPKPSESDTAQGSNPGDHHDRMDMNTPAASSPPPILATTAISIET